MRFHSQELLVSQCLSKAGKSIYTANSNSAYTVFTKYEGHKTLGTATRFSSSPIWPRSCFRSFSHVYSGLFWFGIFCLIITSPAMLAWRKNSICLYYLIFISYKTFTTSLHYHLVYTDISRSIWYGMNFNKQLFYSDSFPIVLYTIRKSGTTSSKFRQNRGNCKFRTLRTILRDPEWSWKILKNPEKFGTASWKLQQNWEN